MEEFHDSVYSGHLGVNKTLHIMERYFWWPNMVKTIGSFVSTCVSCQRNKQPSTKPAGLLQPLDVPGRPWASVSTDFISGLPVTKSGFDAIVVFVDRLTKYVHVVPTTTRCTAKMWTNLFVVHVFANHGMVDEVIFDRGPQFAGKFNEHLAERLGIKWKLSTAYHPQTDGQTERTNRTIEDMLRHFVSPATDDWDQYLPEIQFAINNAWQESVRNTPFYLNYGFHPKTPLAAILPKGRELASKNPASAKYSLHMQQTLAKAKRCMLDAQQRQKHYYNGRHKPSDFLVGNLVLLATKFLNLRTGGTKKLWPRWVGPFMITTRIGSMAYRLELPGSMRSIHNVFHVSLIKEYKSDGRTQPPPAPDIIGDLPEFTVQKILKHRHVVRGRQDRLEFLVSWTGYGDEHNTWEEELNLENAPGLVAAYWRKQPAQVKSSAYAAIRPWAAITETQSHCTAI